jgi:hypothetical protein
MEGSVSQGKDVCRASSNYEYIVAEMDPGKSRTALVDVRVFV